MREGKIIIEGATFKDVRSMINEVVDAVITKHLANQVQEQKTPQYINKKEVGKLLGISESSVNNYMRIGILPYYKIGGKVLFKENEIDKIIPKMESIKYKHVG